MKKITLAIISLFILLGVTKGFTHGQGAVTNALNKLETALDDCPDKTTYKAESLCYKRRVEKTISVLDDIGGGDRDRRKNCDRIDDPVDKFECEKNKLHRVLCSGSNSYGKWGQGGGCNSYKCWYKGGGCNSYGCWYQGGSCNSYGCTRKQNKTKQACVDL